MKITYLLILVVYLLSPATVTASQNQQSTTVNGTPGESLNLNVNKLNITSRDQAIQLVKRQYKGKVLNAQSIQVNGHKGYQIKLISNKGVIFYVSVDAQTSRVSRN